MGEPDTKSDTAVGSTPATTTVGGRSKKLYVKIWGLIVGVIVIVAAIAVILWYAFDGRKNSTDNSSSTNTTQNQTPTNNLNPDQKVQYLAGTGDYAAAEQALEGQLSGANTADSKLSIYGQQVSVALKFKHYDDAQTYANKAVKLAPDSSASYAMLASIASAKGDTASYKSYLQQAIDHLDKNSPQYDLQLQNYQNELEKAG